MGTRNLTVIIKDKKIRLAQYGQWDGYFGCAGEKFVNFIKTTSMTYFKENVDLLKPITEETLDAIIKESENNQTLSKNKLCVPFSVMYPQFSRDTGVGILKVIRSIEKYDLKGKKFPIFIGDIKENCRWVEFVYILDLDNDFVYMLSNWEFYGVESVPTIISKNFPLDCFYKSSIDELPSLEEIKEVLKAKREDGFLCD